MTKKKIYFSQKPASIENSRAIDDWVLSKSKDDPLQLLQLELSVKRFTIVIPEILYKKLRIKCAKNNITLKNYMVRILEKDLID